MGNKTEVLNLKELRLKLDKIADVDVKKALELAAIKVRDDAKVKVPNRHGELEKSITYHFLDNYTVEVGTNKQYAPYVEIGTGIYAGEYTQGLYNQYLGTGRQEVPWAWPATEEDVRDYGVMGDDGKYLNVSYSKDGQAFIWTFGQKAQPYLLPALLENELWITQELGAQIMKEVGK